MRRKQTPAERAVMLFELYEQRCMRSPIPCYTTRDAQKMLMDAFERIVKRGIDADPRSLDARRLVLSIIVTRPNNREGHPAWMAFPFPAYEFWSTQFQQSAPNPR